MADSLLLTGLGQRNYLKYFTFQATPDPSRSMMLWKNNYVPGPVSTLFDLTPATFTGYSSLAIGLPYSAPVYSAPWWQAEAPPKIFVCSGPTGLPQTMYGYAVLESGTDVIWVQRYPTPVAFTASGKALRQVHFDRFRSRTSSSAGDPQLVTDYGLEAFTKLGSGGSIADTGYVAGLFLSPSTITNATVASDFTEPTFTGYSRQAVSSWNAPYDSSFGGNVLWRVEASSILSWYPSGGWTGSQSVAGVFYVGNSTGLLYWAGLFGAPQVVTNTLSGVIALPAFALKSYYVL